MIKAQKNGIVARVLLDTTIKAVEKQRIYKISKKDLPTTDRMYKQLRLW